ncbi:hypothetical protein HPB49_025458 [Dermacentor silvarum]|uniref:Uncharacterized protein n=1 Tax=Dermacentor silvarum TaxID=543639 RepID=A0ACB8CCI5_DERSI|nr:hypothetical protein HPB49_025458 [Dermacentor silvarum]
MRGILQVAMLLSLVPLSLAPFLRERRPLFYDSDTLQDNVDIPGGKVRIHQPYIYQLFQVVVVLANVGLVCGTSIIVLRCMRTCGASRCQDVTINYRLLFHAYTASSWIVCASVIFVAAFALSCDYSLDKGMKSLDKYVQEYKGRIHTFLDEKMVQAAKTTFERMSEQLKKFRRLFSKVFGGLASRAIALKMRKELGAPSIFSEKSYNNNDSNNFQCYQRCYVLDPVPEIRTYSIVTVMVFVVITMGGMMAGFTLGFANHYGHASPLERNTLSNVAGYILVLTSHLMVFGSSLMLLSAGIFMLMGCIGDIYLCRAQRSYYQGDAEPLKDLKIVEFQTDLVHHYKIDIRALVEEITGRWSIVKEFWDLFNKTDLLFDNIGVCSNIVDIFTDGFNIICNGMIDFVGNVSVSRNAWADSSHLLSMTQLEQ